MPWKGSLPRRSTPTDRCAKWIPAIRWRGLFYVWVLVLNRRADAVDAVVDGFPAEVRDTIPARLASFLADALAGKGADAHEATTDEIEGLVTGTDVFPRMLAQAHALAGRPERALSWLAIAIDRGFINYPYLAQHDPFFESLRGLERFRELMQIARERWEAFEV